MTVLHESSAGSGVPKTILETPRLTLREMTGEDYPALAGILRDEHAMYAYEGAFSEEETRGWLDRQQERYRKDGFGLWAAVLKNNGRMIGQAGLTRQEIDGGQVCEIGYLFSRSLWGRGYATEAAAACKKYAFETLGCGEVFSLIRDTNIRSINVAIRNGMLIRRRTIRRYRGIDMPHYVFSAKR